MSYCQEKINLQNTFVKYLIPIKICVPLIFAHLACMKIKAIGGSRFKKACQACFEELIDVVSMLFTECQNSTPFRRYDQFNFWGFDFYIGKNLQY